MRKVPTKSAMPANTSKKVLKNPSADLISDEDSSALWVPVMASTPSGKTLRTRSRSSS